MPIRAEHCRSTVTFTIVDGGLGDDDVTANGTVVDAGGPAIAAAVDPVEPIPVLSHGLLVLMAIVLALLAAAALPRRAGRR